MVRQRNGNFKFKSRLHCGLKSQTALVSAHLCTLRKCSFCGFLMPRARGSGNHLTLFVQNIPLQRDMIRLCPQSDSTSVTLVSTLLLKLDAQHTHQLSGNQLFFRESNENTAIVPLQTGSSATASPLPNSLGAHDFVFRRTVARSRSRALRSLN